jgi:asparagine synthase (glutamine-hydrolysing)
MDQETAYFGLELRYPFLDHNVVEFMARTPRNMRDGELGAKHVLRVFARKYIDASCFLRKRGFSVPMHHWVLGPLRDFCKDKLTALRTAGLFRPEAVDEVRGWVEQGDGVYPEGYFPVGKIWQLVSTQVWLEGFFGATG